MVNINVFDKTLIRINLSNEVHSRQFFYRSKLNSLALTLYFQWKPL